MRKERLYVISVIVGILVLLEPVEGKKVIIHVPYRVKNVKHTHTVYKVLSSKQDHHHRHDHYQKKKGKKAKDEDSEEFDHYKKR